MLHIYIYIYTYIYIYIYDISSLRVNAPLLHTSHLVILFVKELVVSLTKRFGLVYRVRGDWELIQQ